MKHILKYSELNENVGQGSIVFIKGKADKSGKRKLFATHILGYSELKPGARMFFLPQDFYRIKIVDGEVKAVKVGLSDAALKSTLNINPSSGKISVVQNNAKTPWHWRSLKHTSLASAIRDLEQEIKMGDYLLEQTERAEPADFTTLYNHIIKKILSVAVLGEEDPELVFTGFKVSDSLQNKIDDAEESGFVNSEIEIEFTCIYVGQEHREMLNEFDMGPILDASLYLNCEAYLKVYSHPGSYDTPPEWDVEVKSVETTLDDAYLEGANAKADSELQQVWNEASSRIKEMDEADLESLLKKNVMIPKHLKKGE